jgi:DNA adenine methylase
MISQSYKRLQDVQVENLPVEQVIERYDRPNTFFYLDPPYHGVKLYKHNFADADFVRLKDRLRTLKGKFLLSINDDPFLHNDLPGLVTSKGNNILQSLGKQARAKAACFDTLCLKTLQQIAALSALICTAI